MIRVERKQGSLFGDNWVYKTILEKFPDHPLVKLRPLIDKIFSQIEEDIKAYYCDGFGRPSYPPIVILKMLLLEYLYNMSDVTVSCSVACNILFRWFCNLDIDEPVPDDTTLVKFRKRLGEEGFKEIFEAFVAEAKKLGFGKGRLRILDATHVLSFSRGLGIVGLLKDGLRRIMKRAKDKVLPLKEKTKEVVLKVTGVKKKVKVKEIKEVVKEVVKELSGKVDEKSEKLLSLLKEVVKRGKAKISSLVDLDACWGYKRKDFPFFGYKVHPVCNENGFVTGLEVLPGNANEGKRLKPVIEKERKGEEIEGVLGDALYDSKENRAYLRKVGIKGYIPPRTKGSEIDKFAIEGEQVMCPAGKYSIGKISQENGFLHYFSVRDCRGCKYYGRCVSPKEVRKKVFLSDCKQLREKDYKEKLRLRKIIERIFAWLKRWLGLTRARYCGIGKTFIQTVLALITLDLKIMIRGPC